MKFDKVEGWLSDVNSIDGNSNPLSLLGYSESIVLVEVEKRKGGRSNLVGFVRSF